MKSWGIVIVGVWLASLLVLPAAAEQRSDSAGESTYLRYHLQHDVILDVKMDTVSNYLESEIDAFDLSLYDDYGRPYAAETEVQIGNIDLVFHYHNRLPDGMADETNNNTTLLDSRLRIPLGETSFQLDAYTAAAVYAAAERSPEIESLATQRYTLSEFVDARDVVFGSIEVSGTIKTFDVYSEVGFVTGVNRQQGLSTSKPLTSPSKTVTLKQYSSEALTEMSALGLEDSQNTGDSMSSGFYAVGGTKYTAGRMILGLEAGFESGTDDTEFEQLYDDYSVVTPEMNTGQLLHNPGSLITTCNQDGSVSDVVYAQVTADMQPSQKLNVSGGVAYVKPMRDIVSADTAKTADRYGLELFGSASYELSDYLQYKLSWGYAMPDKDFVEENQYQIINQVEFRF